MEPVGCVQVSFCLVVSTSRQCAVPCADSRMASATGSHPGSALGICCSGDASPPHWSREQRCSLCRGSTAAEIRPDPGKESRSRWVCRRPFTPQWYRRARMARGPAASKTAAPVRWGAGVGGGGPAGGSPPASAPGVYFPMHPSRVRNVPVGLGGRRAR